MNRYIVPVIGLVLVVALAGVAGVNFAQVSGVQADTQQMGPLMTSGDDMHMFPGLEGVPPEQMFDHFMGGQFTMTDANGTLFTTNIIPGTVSSVDTTTITITPNGQTTTQTFNVTPDTIVHGMPDPGSFQAITQGDKVVVMTRDTSNDAVMIFKHGERFHQRMMESMMQ